MDWKSIGLNAAVSAVASLIAVLVAAMVAIDGLEYQELRKAQIQTFTQLYAGRDAIFSSCRSTPEAEDRTYSALNGVLALYADSPEVAAAYRRYWESVRQDKRGAGAQQAFLDMIRAMGEHIEIDTSGITDRDLRRTFSPHGYGDDRAPGPRSSAGCVA